MAQALHPDRRLRTLRKENMGIIDISVVVLEGSRTLENTLVRVQVPLDAEDAAKFREDIDKWVQVMPLPGGELSPLILTDPVERHAARLESILEPEVELFDWAREDALGERKPYDWAAAV